MTIEQSVVTDKKLLRKQLGKLLKTISEKELSYQCRLLVMYIFFS